MSAVFKIKYDSERHKRIKEALLDRKALSFRKMGDKHEDWRRSEELYLAYLPETEENRLRGLDRDTGVPQYTTIEIPYSYAVLLTAHTYWSQVFLSRTPILQFQGSHRESADNELAVEAIINYQVRMGEMMVPLYNWLLDGGKYGLGVLGLYWDEELVTVSEIVEQPKTYLGIPIPGTMEKKKQTREIPGYMGNKVYNVRPYDFYPDPRVPISMLQQGEFVGREVERGWNEIVKGAHKGKFFNIDALKKLRRKGVEKKDDYGSEQIDIPDASEYAGTTDDIEDMGFVKLLEMYVELVPGDWGLGDGKQPEKWYFVVANDEVIICATPYGAFHNKFPFFVQSYEIDAYALYTRSMMEILKPLNDILSWLFDTHFQSVRSVINDNLIIDPSRLVMKDVLDPLPGRMWRLRPEAYGTDPRMAVHQLQVQDVTQVHVRDAAVVIDMIQRVSSVTDNIMGLVNQGGRKTATEVRSSNTLGINRLKTIAEYNSHLGWAPLSQSMLQNTQQYYDMERSYRIAGANSQGLQDKFIDVSPETIAGFYDYVPVDGTLPIDRYAMANLWREIAGEGAKIPQVAGELDFFRIFDHIAQLTGIKNFSSFRIKVVPDGQALTGATRGNLVPIGGPNAGTGGRGEADFARVSEPGQVSGVGPTG